VKRAGILRREFGMDEADYQRLHAHQAGLCAICDQPETKRHRDGSLLRLSIDHDHETGAVRGLLCQRCNVGLGSFVDSIQRLRAAADYLERR
jgi:Recombination endonuclease VII